MTERKATDLSTTTCNNCGAPLMDFDGISAFIAGAKEVFCRSTCVGQRRQQELISCR